MKQCKNSSVTSWRRDIFVSPNHPTHHHFSSSRKRTASCDPCKTTGRSTHSRFEINTPSLSSWSSAVTSAMHTYIHNSTSDGGTTTYASAKVTKRKRHSKPDTVFSNTRSCISDLQTRQRPSK